MNKEGEKVSATSSVNSSHFLRFQSKELMYHDEGEEGITSLQKMIEGNINGCNEGNATLV